jgi:hypothetical protein
MRSRGENLLLMAERIRFGSENSHLWILPSEWAINLDTLKGFCLGELLLPELPDPI